MKKNDITEPARAGYAGAINPHLYSSPNYYAHALGAYFKASGRAEPRDVRMSRGYVIWANDMRFSITDAPKGAPSAVSFTRVE